MHEGIVVGDLHVWNDLCGGLHWSVGAKVNGRFIEVKGDYILVFNVRSVLRRISRKYSLLLPLDKVWVGRWYLQVMENTAQKWYEEQGWLLPDEPRLPYVFAAWGPVVNPLHRICRMRQAFYVYFQDLELSPRTVAEVLSAVIAKEEGRKR